MRKPLNPRKSLFSNRSTNKITYGGATHPSSLVNSAQLMALCLSKLWSMHFWLSNQMSGFMQLHTSGKPRIRPTTLWRLFLMTRAWLHNLGRMFTRSHSCLTPRNSLMKLHRLSYLEMHSSVGMRTDHCLTLLSSMRGVSVISNRISFGNN